MTPARWNVVGMLGVLLCAVAWIAWGASRDWPEKSPPPAPATVVVGSWSIAYDPGPMWISDGALMTRIDVQESGDGLEAVCFTAATDSADDAVTRPLSPVEGDDHAWTCADFTLRLIGPDEIQMTGVPESDGESPVWSASARRR